MDKETENRYFIICHSEGGGRERREEGKSVRGTEGLCPQEGTAARKARRKEKKSALEGREGRDREEKVHKKTRCQRKRGKIVMEVTARKGMRCTA